METLKEMTSELMKKIYTDEKFRNAVAYAHGCFDSRMNFLHYKALYWPEREESGPEGLKRGLKTIVVNYMIPHRVIIHLL